MSKKTFSEITEIANTLSNQFKTLKEDAMARYDLYTMRRVPELSPNLAREGQVNILSPLIIHAAHSIRADLMMNPTEFMITPLGREPNGGIPVRHSRFADNLEKSLAVIWGKLNDNRKIDREVIWHQLVSPFGVMVLECGDLELPDQPQDMSDSRYADLLERHQKTWLPWHITTPDPLTCAFLERDGQPTLFVRRYKQLIRDVERSYSRRRGDFMDYDIKFINDHWEWMKASDEYDPMGFRQGTSNIQEVEMIWLDDGENIYHIAMNYQSDKAGEVVWQGKNPLGRVSAFLVSSSITPLRNPEDRYEPFLWPLMQAVDGVNGIRTTRATASRNVSGPDQYIPLDPEIVKAYELAGKKLPATLRYNKNETPYTLGVIAERPAHVDPDMDKLELALQQDLQRFLPSPFTHIVDPAVLKAATATSILHAAESGMRMYGPLMSSYDGATKSLMEGLIYSIEHFYKEATFYTFASGQESARGKNLSEGHMFKLGPEELDFPYMLNVKTRSMSQAQASAQFDLALKQWVLPDGTKGPATFDDILDAANYSDREAQKEKLASERILNAIDPWIQQMALAEAVVEIEYATGIQLPLGTEPGTGTGGAGQNQPDPSGIPSSAQRMDSPLVTGPAGGSDATTTSQ